MSTATDLRMMQERILWSEMAKDFNADDFVEVWETDSAAEADRLVHMVLAPEGIEAVIHDRTSHAFPAPSTAPGAASVAVPIGDKEKAVQLIAEYLKESESAATSEGAEGQEEAEGEEEKRAEAEEGEESEAEEAEAEEAEADAEAEEDEPAEGEDKPER